MYVHKQHLTIQDPNHVVLSQVPFSKGQKIEVLLIAENEQPTKDSKNLKALFKETQSLSHIQKLSLQEIEAEVHLFRSGDK